MTAIHRRIVAFSSEKAISPTKLHFSPQWAKRLRSLVPRSDGGTRFPAHRAYAANAEVCSFVTCHPTCRKAWWKSPSAAFAIGSRGLGRRAVGQGCRATRSRPLQRRKLTLASRRAPALSSSPRSASRSLPSRPHRSTSWLRRLETAQFRANFSVVKRACAMSPRNPPGVTCRSARPMQRPCKSPISTPRSTTIESGLRRILPTCCWARPRHCSNPSAAARFRSMQTSRTWLQMN